MTEINPLRYLLVLVAAALLLVPHGRPISAQVLGSMPEEVPLFVLADHKGNEVALEDLRGSVVLINFWATWCPPCVAEMPSLQALKDALDDRPFEVLAINMAEDAETISRFLERTGIDVAYPLLLDPGGVVADQYRVRQLPATLLVDQQGKFAFGGVGERDWASPEVMEEIIPLFN